MSFLLAGETPPRPPLPQDTTPPRPPPPETDDEDDAAFPIPQANQPIMVSRTAMWGLFNLKYN